LIYSGDPATFVPSHERAMSEGEQWLVNCAAESFVETGKWPVLKKLVREAARQKVDLPQAIYGMSVQDFIWRPDNDGTIILSIPGLWRSSTGRGLVVNADPKQQRAPVESGSTLVGNLL
jgi:hypothetical protein